jgi:polysaccharide export outer membrane protein
MFPARLAHARNRTGNPMKRPRPTAQTANPRPKWSVLLGAVLVLIPAAALGDYRLQPGDVLDVSITGVPDFKEHPSIGIEGDIGLPLAGQIKVSTLSISQAREQIAAALANKVSRQFTPDGREISHLILGGEVVVTVSEYSPVYVSGDVGKPGAYPFRPGLTVRQAAAVAGGYAPIRLQAPDATLQIADLESEYQTLRVDFAAEQARLWRLRTELGKDILEHTGSQAPNPDDGGKQFMQAEAEQLDARKTDLDGNKALLQKAIMKAATQLQVLAEKKTRDEDGSQADLADYNTVRDLFRKGLAASTRLSEARRAALLSSEQFLQTIVEMSNVERQRDEYARQLEAVDSRNRIDDLQELQKSHVHLAEISARLQSVSEKMIRVGALRSQVGPGTGTRLQIVVHRKGENGPQVITADEDLQLAPGDVVDVALQGGTVPLLLSSAKISAEKSTAGIIPPRN